MSFTNQSGDLGAFTEVVPASVGFQAPERSSILTQRRRVRVSPQTGQSYPSALGGSGAGGAQIQFLVADQGGLLDCSSMCINYTIQTTGTSVGPDDGHPFSTFQVLLNGQLVEQLTNASKLANVEMTVGGSKTYYQTAGSLQGFELLNNDLVTDVPSSSVTASITAWGYAAGNQASISTRAQRASNIVFNNIAGEQRSIPLGLICGFGRMKQYLPISVLGEVAIQIVCGSAADVLFTTSSTTTGDYSLAQVSLEYDIVVASTAYSNLLQQVAMNDEKGLLLPYESSIVAPAAAIAASSAALLQSDLIVSRATNNLLRATVVQIPQTLTSSLNYPSQSSFSHGGVVSLQYRIGSSVYPQIAASGDASLFNMTLAAYGSVMQENGTVTNRVLWGNSTNGATAGTAAVYETAQVASGGSVKFAYADRFTPTYGFQVVKGEAQPLAVDGVSLAGASGSQLIASLISAPAVAYTPFVILTALRFIKAQGGGVQVIGA